MRLATFSPKGEPSPPTRMGRRANSSLAVMIDEGELEGTLVDLHRANILRLQARSPASTLDGVPPPGPLDMIELLELGAWGFKIVGEILAWVVEAAKRDRAEELIEKGALRRAGTYRLLAPIPHPRKIIGVARNYAAHAAERGGRAAPTEPVLFVKASSAATGPHDTIPLPSATRQIDYEGELGVIIGGRVRDVSARGALRYVAGYTIANDVTARDFQNVRGQHFIGKSCDGFAPLGPVLLTRDEVPDPRALEIVTRVAGDIRQRAHCGDMIFPVEEIVSFASRLMTLEPGDIILTGTPAGVGAAANPPRWLADGDLVEVEIDPIGSLRNPVATMESPT